MSGTVSKYNNGLNTYLFGLLLIISSCSYNDSNSVTLRIHIDNQVNGNLEVEIILKGSQPTKYVAPPKKSSKFLHAGRYESYYDSTSEYLFNYSIMISSEDTQSILTIQEDNIYPKDLDIKIRCEIDEQVEFCSRI